MMNINSYNHTVTLDTSKTIVACMYVCVCVNAYGNNNKSSAEEYK